MVGRRGHARQPCLHRPRQRVTRARLADCDRPGHRYRRVPRELGRRPRLALQDGQRRGGVASLAREPGGELPADPEDRVVRPRRGDPPDREAPPLRELLRDQPPGDAVGDLDLAGVHPHGAPAGVPGLAAHAAMLPHTAPAREAVSQRRRAVSASAIRGAADFCSLLEPPASENADYHSAVIFLSIAP